MEKIRSNKKTIINRLRIGHTFTTHNHLLAKKSYRILHNILILRNKLYR